MAKKETLKPEPVKKEEVLKEKPKLEEVVPKKDLTEKEPKVEDKVREEDKVGEKDEASKNQAVGESLALQDDAALLMGREDKLLFDAYQIVQGQINETWAPPQGMEEGVSCELKILIDLNGKLNKIIVDKPSGIAIFDVSVKLALKKIEWPKYFYSKEIKLTFRL